MKVGLPLGSIDGTLADVADLAIDAESQGFDGVSFSEALHSCARVTFESPHSQLFSRCPSFGWDSPDATSGHRGFCHGSSVRAGRTS